MNDGTGLTQVDIAERSAADLPSQPVFIANPQFHRSSMIIYDYTQNVVRNGGDGVWCRRRCERRVHGSHAVTGRRTRTTT